MVADAVAPCVATTSASMILAMKFSSYLRKDLNYLRHVNVEDVEDLACKKLPSSLQYKTHQISTFKRFSYCPAAVFAESLEARC